MISLSLYFLVVFAVIHSDYLNRHVKQVCWSSKTDIKLIITYLFSELFIV